jgi:4-hydroxy-tetrahydrodipicolinate synthase
VAPDVGTSAIEVCCRTATTFTAAGELDEEAQRRFLERLVARTIGVYLGSGGAGEGHALSSEELGRLYRIGVAVGKGRVRVHANQPERHTVADTVAHAQLAIACGVDSVNLYGPAGWHGYEATDEEYISYFDQVLEVIHHPVALCPNPGLGYATSPHAIATICRTHHQVEVINLSGIAGDSYLIELRETLPDRVRVFVDYPGALSALSYAGADGIISAHPNLIPATFRRFADCYESGNTVGLGAAYREITRFGCFTGSWRGSSARWIKTGMQAFDLPGGAGGPRPPYLKPTSDEVRRFRDRTMELHLSEIADLVAQRPRT